ncbi:MAG: class I SAM-dependent methyltransferase [Methylophilaceae bacterium]
MSALPTPSPQAQQQSEQLVAFIQQNIAQSGGWISFAAFMHMALYTPKLGYYTGGAEKFGQAGDFVTAPEISPLFAQTIAKQVAQILAINNEDVLELGAGTGKLAADLLLALKQLGQLPNRYFILEVSSYLRETQQQTLQKKLPPDLYQRIIWLDTLPTSITGVVLANEVLDALPVHIIHKKNKVCYERGVAFTHQLTWQDEPLQDSRLRLAEHALHNDYLMEVCPAAIGLINSLASSLKQGAILLLDYGFSAREYYHPQRSQGTLMCHYQHYAHDNPLINIGLQDITAHVNFSAIATAGVEQGLKLAGYCHQTQFLMNCGILDLLAAVSAEEVATYLPLAAAAQKLLSPAEMGELFKVMALTKNMDTPLLGFIRGDKSHTL